MNTVIVDRVTTTSNAATAIPVAQNERIDFVDVMYRKDFILFHVNLLIHLKRITDCFPARAWDHYRLYNGGTYMAPTYAPPTAIVIDGRNTGIALNGDALGICACIITLSEMGAYKQFAWMKNLFNRLQDYIWEHPQKAEIQKAVLAYRMHYTLGHPA